MTLEWPGLAQAASIRPKTVLQDAKTFAAFDRRPRERGGSGRIIRLS